jgi:hypothetical protein
VARGLASLGVEFSEEAVEPVTGYRVDMLLHGREGAATGRCVVEVGVGTAPLIAVVVVGIWRQPRQSCVTTTTDTVAPWLHKVSFGGIGI